MVDIIGKRYYFFALSIIFIAIGIFSYYRHDGFNYDIQFQGGTIMQFELTYDAENSANNKTAINDVEKNNFVLNTSKAQDILKKELNKEITAIQSQTIMANLNAQNVKVPLLSIYVPSQSALTIEEQNKVKQIITSNFKLEPNSQPSTTHVDPSIGKELKNKSIMAVTISAILIILYIWARFHVMSGLSAGIFAVVGLLHDVALMVSVYTIFDIRLNESFIAAALTIMGYSMNDTIIIYDRIRENSKLLKKVSIKDLVNKSIIQTLARSINTVVTVLICVITVYVFASYYHIQSIKDFALPLIIGIASGCYSSIFVTCPLWVMWQSRAKNGVVKSESL